MSTIVPPYITQIAMSVHDLRRTHQWYQDVFGLVPAGGTEMFKGWLTEKVQGVPGANNTCWWLMDQQDFFQLEFFQFHRPEAKPLPVDWRPCDIGYTTVGMYVEDFDATLARAARFGSHPLSEAMGSPGSRRVCLRDPEGVLLELMEEDIVSPSRRLRPRSSVPAAIRFLTASVHDLEASVRFFRDGLQFEEATEFMLHGAEHEALWGLGGARRDSTVLWAGDIALELVRYDEPSGKPWPDGYLSSDQGLLNFAIGFRTRREMRSFLKRAKEAAATPNWVILDTGVFAVVYVDDPQGFSVELLCVSEGFEKKLGFREWTLDTYVEESIVIDAASSAVWERLVDHENMGEWMGVRAELTREGEERNGPGALRTIRTMGLNLVEEVTDWEPGKRLDYRLRSGVPMKYHMGRVELSEVENGIRVQWSVHFQGKFPGIASVLKVVLGKGLKKGLSGLKGELESTS